MSETIGSEVFQKKQSASGCSNVLLWLLFIAIILSCLCCAGTIGSTYLALNSIINGYEIDPVAAQQKTEEAFGELSLPENVKPYSILKLKLLGKERSFAGIYSWKVAGKSDSTEAAAKPERTTAEPEEEKTADAAPAEEEPSDDTTQIESDDKGVIVFYSLSNVIKKSLFFFLNRWEKMIVIDDPKGDVNSAKEFTVKSSETVSVTINGKANDFTFSLLEENRGVNKKTFKMVSGSFTSKTGKTCDVMIYLPGNVPQETIVNVLENLQK